MPFLELFNPGMAFSQLGRRASNRQATQVTEVDSSVGGTASGLGDAGQESEGVRRRRTPVDAVRDIARSLEVLNASLSTGAELDRLTTMVQNLRERLRQETADAVEEGQSVDHLEFLVRSFDTDSPRLLC